jgi:hypothetical protein
MWKRSEDEARRALQIGFVLHVSCQEHFGFVLNASRYHLSVPARPDGSVAVHKGRPSVEGMMLRVSDEEFSPRRHEGHKEEL